MFGLDYFTLAIAFLFFVVVLGVLWNIVWHTFHGDIAEVFRIVIAIVITAAAIFMILSCTI